LTVTPDADDARAWLACDAQTSGGLLIACPMAECLALRDLMRAEGIPAAVVGEIVAGDGATVTIR
jgi:selenophosphate synthase